MQLLTNRMGVSLLKLIIETSLKLILFSILRNRQDGYIHPKNFTHGECPALSQMAWYEYKEYFNFNKRKSFVLKKIKKIET